MSSISETVSKKRGRPSVIPPEYRDTIAFMNPEATTERAKQDTYFRLIALGALNFDPRFLWLADQEKMTAGIKEPDSWRPGILTELGRLREPALIRSAAEVMCQMKPETTKKAIAIIRQWRIGERDTEPNLIQLSSDIAKAIDNYTATHPRTKPWMILEALSGIAGLVQEMADEARE